MSVLRQNNFNLGLSQVKNWGFTLGFASADSFESLQRYTRHCRRHPRGLRSRLLTMVLHGSLELEIFRFFPCDRVLVLGFKDHRLRLCVAFGLRSLRKSPLQMRSGPVGWSGPAPSQSGRRWLGTDIAQPGMSDGREQYEPCGRAAIPTSQGSKTSRAEHLSGVTPGVTMLVISWDPEHQDLVDVDSGCVTGRAWTRLCIIGVRNHCWPRGLRRTLAGVSVCDTKGRGEVGQPPPVSSPRCESEQAEGRRPCLVTTALCDEEFPSRPQVAR